MLDAVALSPDVRAFIQDFRGYIEVKHIVILATLTLFWIGFRRIQRMESGHVKEVRRLASAGAHDRAGELQMREGNLEEAYNLFVRGNHHARASQCAEKLGRLPQAAEHAISAGNIDRAAQLYEQMGQWTLAAQHYARAGRPLKAAEAAAHDPTMTPDQVADFWEDAFTAAEDDVFRDPSAVAMGTLSKIARKAYEAQKRAGNQSRAAHFKRLLDPANVTLTYGHAPGAQAAADQLPKIPTPSPPQPAEGVPRQVAPSPSVPPASPAAGSDHAAERYELQEKLGEGGMGVVYRAQDRVLERTVAMKFLPESLTASDLAKEMFAKEAKAAAAVNHPNIITVHDYGVMNGRPFLCMEFVEGVSVDEMLRHARQGLALGDALEIGAGLFTALGYAHGRGVVHRDVKPANVMRTHEGVVKLADFGIAKLMEPGKGQTKIVGTPPYMAPEQFTGQGIDARTDVFAAGVTLYELLTGQLPYEGIDRSKRPVGLREHRSDIPAMVEEVVLLCIEPDIEDRPVSAVKLAKAMKKLRAKYAAAESGIRPSLFRAAPPPTTPAATVGDEDEHVPAPQQAPAQPPASRPVTAFDRMRSRRPRATNTGYAVVKSRDESSNAGQPYAGTMAMGADRKKR